MDVPTPAPCNERIFTIIVIKRKISGPGQIHPLTASEPPESSCAPDSCGTFDQLSRLCTGTFPGKLPHINWSQRPVMTQGRVSPAVAALRHYWNRVRVRTEKPQELTF